MADCLGDAERNTYAIGEDQGRHPIEDRDGQTVLDGVPHWIVVAGGGAEIQNENLAEPLHVGDDDRLVEAVVGFQVCDLIVGQRTPAKAVVAGCRAGEVAAGYRGFLEHALDGPTRNQAGEDEDQDSDADERRDDQQESADKVTGHRNRDRGA